jgi:hypothetical protein
VLCRDRRTAKWAAGPFDSATHGWTARRTTVDHPMTMAARGDRSARVTDSRLSPAPAARLRRPTAPATADMPSALPPRDSG